MIEKIKQLLKEELNRQENEIDLIASENYASQTVLDACGSYIQNKYSEGYIPYDITEHGYELSEYKRYYAGCRVVDDIEKITVDLVCKAFGTKYANVQSHCGSSANLAVYVAATKYFKCKPNDLTIISHSLDAGSHLTHGSKASISGKWFNAKQFDTDEHGLFNYNEMKKIIEETNGPMVLVIGFSAYPREVKYNEIAEMVKKFNRDMIVLVDSSHVSGLIVTKEHQNPFDYDWGKAHVVLTSTTHKTLRGPRHALITTNDIAIAKLIDKSVFPGINGGALQNMIAALGISMSEALQPSFKDYVIQVKKNTQAMVKVFNDRKVPMITCGSDNHLILIDLKNKKISGKQLEETLEKLGIITNKNSVKDDPRPKMETSGLRIGTAAVTTRGAKEKDCENIATTIADVIYQLETFNGISDKFFDTMSNEVKQWCKEHPIYKEK